MTKTIYIEGMSCGHCVGHVEEALKEICGVKAVSVDLQKKFATVELAHEVEDEKFKSAIDDAGYEVVKIEG
ncbi:copper ion binding protein [Petroclostridium sp. X23]|uniref:heavy-metal-associated domain-containing protein n=1 Tax=Petroclostridium sp. X23 TaxID=3045146 RepID=UPI0024AD0B4C|nr:copper ion binding protein [Petroclostridium sp. X23]WHH59981.1 copper ion binding protein [Petroclostridium sp. X23]